ncbi:MAG: hypothetical protein COV72_02530 [Candidatus Omnitrophica bacterium CG11_big_fil_rev_8_21_14_0_20_42_13]|uniref:Doubled CXXCH motif domain-containing protein n=1 Tax=Candidatus Ghiorseimicrobium undicola TaxID=1974746 RepID=A0A2H0LYK7_9BACT|nr:MAG: hypothetical protein COV72_02530 [Candidatus Omnitrophica bacterium CG11_big_fil_rev_8_21_14_0_20_42_13]
MPRAFGVKNTIILIFICAFIFPALSFSALVFAQESEFKEKCRSCHKEVLDKWDMSAIKHYPYREGKCESCHAAEHKKFTAEAGKPCLICHDLTSEKIKNSHFSVNLSDVDCFSCHYTHSAEKKGLLKESVHMPFSSGMCEMCHSVDGGKIKVKDMTKKSCLACHGTLVSKDDSVKHMGYEMQECVDCHNPHTSSHEKLLKSSVSENCFQCHDREQAKKHPYDVSVSSRILNNMLDKDKKIWLTYSNKISCTSCHLPHSARIPFLLRDSLDQGELCNHCHIKSK